LRLRRTRDREEFLVAREAELKNSAVDLSGRSAVLGELAVAGASLAVARGKTGDWNLATLFPAGVPPIIAAETRPTPQPPALKSAPAWTFTVGRLTVGESAVTVEDAAPATPVRLKLAPVSLVAEGLSTVSGTRGTIDLHCAVNGSGSVSLRGSLGLEPTTARLAAEVTALPLVAVQGYVTDRLHLVVNDGTASAAGELSVTPGTTGPSVGFSGRASVDHLATVDAYVAEDLLKWDSLALERVAFSSEPYHLEIGEIGLSGLAARIAIAPDGTANLRRVLGGTPPPTADEQDESAEGPSEPAEAATPGLLPSPAPSPSPSAVASPEGAPPTESDQTRVGKILIHGGAVAFVDRSVSPEFLVSVTTVEGSLSGLSSLASTASDVDLRGIVNGQAPLSVKGRINPLAGNLFADLKVVARDFDLPPVSPYSGAWAGYAIQRGKLSVDLAYKVSQRRLSAQNLLLIDQFDFGEKVESPKATHLPVRLAVSLLKDRNGLITLDLPVSGSLDDPKFRVGRVILKMLGHLLVKVATSPFALLGSLVGGGGADLDTVVFAPGSAALDDAARGRLDKLARALYDRPGLRLEAAGRADPTVDREGLRSAALQRAIKREKLDDLIKSGGTVPSLDAVTVAPAEYETFLTRAYKHGKFAKPRNLLGVAKTRPVPEMERLLLDSLEPDTDALRQLAQARAEVVQGYLLQTGKVQAGQVFIVASSGVGAPAGKGPSTRVDLAIK
jgi:hypothetical protein